MHYEQIVAEKRNPQFWTPDSCVIAAKIVSQLDTRNVLLFSELWLKNFKSQKNTQEKRENSTYGGICLQTFYLLFRKRN